MITPWGHNIVSSGERKAAERAAKELSAMAEFLLLLSWNFCGTLPRLNWKNRQCEFLTAVADFPGITMVMLYKHLLRKPVSQQKGRVSSPVWCPLSEHWQEHCWGSFCSPAPGNAASLGSALAAAQGLCPGRVQRVTPKCKTWQHWSEAAALQLALTWLCRELICWLPTRHVLHFSVFFSPTLWNWDRR